MSSSVKSRTKSLKEIPTPFRLRKTLLLMGLAEIPDEVECIDVEDKSFVVFRANLSRLTDGQLRVLCDNPSFMRINFHDKMAELIFLTEG